MKMIMWTRPPYFRSWKYRYLKHDRSEQNDRPSGRRQAVLLGGVGALENASRVDTGVYNDCRVMRENIRRQHFGFHLINLFASWRHCPVAVKV